MATTNVLVTGGAGFIGSNFVRHALTSHPDWRVTTLDKLTYAGRLENLKGVIDHPRHEFVRGDVADPAVAGPLVTASDIVVHFAAETHVDRSIMNAGEFITTDVFGTFVLLEAAREAGRCGSSSRSRPTRSTAASRKDRAWRPTSCGRETLTRPARRGRIGWPTATGPRIRSPSSSPARRTTTARTSFPRRSSRSSSPTPSTIGTCRSTATG